MSANPATALNSNHYLVTAVLNVKRAKVSKPSNTQTHTRQPDNQAKQAFNTLITASIQQQPPINATDPDGPPQDEEGDVEVESTQQARQPDGVPESTTSQRTTQSAEWHGHSSGCQVVGHTGVTGMGFARGSEEATRGNTTANQQQSQAEPHTFSTDWYSQQYPRIHIGGGTGNLYYAEADVPHTILQQRATNTDTSITHTHHSQSPQAEALVHCPQLPRMSHTASFGNRS